MLLLLLLLIWCLQVYMLLLLLPRHSIRMPPCWLVWLLCCILRVLLWLRLLVVLRLQVVLLLWLLLLHARGLSVLHHEGWLLTHLLLLLPCG